MKYFCIALISFYQRFLSPYKGFNCAHQVLHQTGSCSNAIKALIDEKGLYKALPEIKERFRECTSAYHRLTDRNFSHHRADLPCDLPCDIGIGDCGGSGKSASTVFDCIWPCDLLSGFSKRTQRRILYVFIVLIVLCSYWFYGRGIGSIYVEDIREKPSILKQLTQRQEPSIRLLVTHQGKKFYSDVVTIKSKNKEYQFKFESSPNDFKIDNLKVLDARVNIGNELFVLGQVLEEFEQPQSNDHGERFAYRIKRRWHFF